MFTRTAVQPQNWSERSLKEFLDARERDALETLDRLVEELGALAEGDLPEAYRRARDLHLACWSRVKAQAARLGIEPFLLPRGHVAREQERTAFGFALGLCIRQQAELLNRSRATRRRTGSRQLLGRGGA